MKFFSKVKRAVRLLVELFKQYKRNHFANVFLQNLLDSINRQYSITELRPICLGPENPHTLIGLIRLPTDWIPTAGFFALFHKTLCGLYFADKLGLVPVVDCWNNCAFEESFPVNGSKNVFEYYFEPVAGISEKSALNSGSVVKITDFNMNMPFFDYNCEWFDMSDEYIQEMGRLCRKYIRFNRTVDKAIKGDMKKIKGKKILGVHFRGTDYAIGATGHPNALQVEDYFQFIDEAMEDYGFDHIFLATDDKTALKKIRERYSKIICYSDVFRGDGKTSVAFMQSIGSERENYRRGYEVLRDAFTLSQCDGLIAGQSQVATHARIFNASGEKEYTYCRVLTRGICRNGVDWIEVFNNTIKK